MAVFSRRASVGVILCVTAVGGSLTVPAGVELFFTANSGYTYNRYLQLYNAGNATVDLSQFTFPNTANSPDVKGQPEYFNNFKEGATLKPGEVYTLVHSKANETILAKADQTWDYLSDRNDGYAIAYGNESEYVILDMVGSFDGDGMRGWDVCGVERATDSHTLLRKQNTSKGNRGDWKTSAGNTRDDCEWLVYAPDNRTALSVWGEIWGLVHVGTSTTSTSTVTTTTETTTRTVTASSSGGQASDRNEQEEEGDILEASDRNEQEEEGDILEVTSGSRERRVGALLLAMSTCLAMPRALGQ